MSLGTSVPNGYILRANLKDSVLSKAIACVPSEYKKIRAQVKKLQRNTSKNIVSRHAKMVGKRI
jgi:hypothetical protein